MSIVGTQSVSMQDLMKLGPQALNAMAQGQVNSIAPSYMVIAALKALTDQQKGAAAPVPANTVKDQVIAQAASPMQAGIGGMLPPQQTQATQPQRFAEGGSVEDSIYRILTNTKAAEDRSKRVADWLRPYQDAANREQMTHKFSASSDIATSPTAPTSPRNENYGNEGRREPVKTTDAAEVAAKEAPVRTGSASVSARSSGVGSTGARNPFVEYGPYNVKAKELSAIEGMNAPENTELDRAIANIQPQQAAKLAQIAKERQAAGLASFGAGMLKGRNFGDTFAHAANASTGAMMEKDKEARLLEMRYEDIARELGLKKGTEAYERFVNDLKYKQSERTFDVTQQEGQQKRGDEITKFRNEYNLAAERNEIARQANAIQAAMRADANKDRYIGVIGRLIEDAHATASKAATEKYGKVDEMGKFLDPQAPQKIAFERDRLLRQMQVPELQEAMRSVLQKEIGIRSVRPQTTPQAAGNRGPLVGK